MKNVLRLVDDQLVRGIHLVQFKITQADQLLQDLLLDFAGTTATKIACLFAWNMTKAMASNI